MADSDERGPGRPSIYTAALATEICERIANGDSLRAVCRDPEMPAVSTVHLWVVEDREGFSDQYARARRAQALHWADEILDIADNGTNDWTVNGRGLEVVDKDVVMRSRLRVDTRKWLLSKVLPKVYGDRVVQEHTGPEGGPIQVTRRIVSVDAP